MRKVTTISLLIISMLSASLSYGASSLPTPSNTAPKPIPKPNGVTQNLDKIAAVVNNEVITQSDFDSALRNAKQRMIAAHAKNISEDQLKNAVLQQLINEKLQLQLAKNADLKISDAQVNSTIEHIAQGNHMTLKQLEAKIQSEGMTMASYKKMLKKQLLIHQVQLSAVGSKVQVSPQDIQNFLEKYKNKLADAQRIHLLDLHIPSTDKAAEARAMQLMTDWKNGKLSQKPVDLGWQSPNSLPNIFLDQVNRMSPGDIAGPIKAPNGLHIIKLIAMKNNAPSEKMPTEAQAKNVLFQMKAQEAVKKWIKKMRKQAYIYIPDAND